MTRRTALKSLAAAAASLSASTPGWSIDQEPREVPWLSEVQTPPERIPRENLGTFEPLLTFPDGRPVKDLEDWKLRRAQIRAAWLKFLGEMPEKRPPVELETIQRESIDGCERTLVRYEGEPGLRVEGYLLRPKGTAATRLKGKNGRLPAIVGLHQTTKNSIDEIAGVQGPESMQIGLQLCRRGFVVFCPRCFLWQGHTDIRQATQDFLKRRPGVLGMRKMLYDAMRGVDVVAAFPDVDPDRIGAVGHSLGGKETFYLAAFDERVRAAVSSEGGVGFRSTNWNAPWYLGEAIQDPAFPRNHHELTALAAPRALLVLAGESGNTAADGDRTWPFIEAALPVYRLYGTPARLGLFNHHKGHAIPPEAFQRTAEWLETYLAARD